MGGISRHLNHANMSSKATLSVWDYIGFAGTAAKIATAVVFASLTGFFRPRKDVLTYREWIQTWTLWGFIHYGTIGTTMACETDCGWVHLICEQIRVHA